MAAVAFKAGRAALESITKEGVEGSGLLSLPQLLCALLMFVDTLSQPGGKLEVPKA